MDKKRVIDMHGLVYDDELTEKIGLKGCFLYARLWSLAEDWGGLLLDSGSIYLKMGGLRKFYTKAKVKEIVDKLIELKKIIPYTHQNRSYGWLKNFPKHQPMKLPSAPKLPLPSWVVWHPKIKEGGFQYYSHHWSENEAQPIQTKMDENQPIQTEKNETQSIQSKEDETQPIDDYLLEDENQPVEIEDCQVLTHNDCLTDVERPYQRASNERPTSVQRASNDIDIRYKIKDINTTLLTSGIVTSKGDLEPLTPLGERFKNAIYRKNLFDFYDESYSFLSEKNLVENMGIKALESTLYANSTFLQENYKLFMHRIPKEPIVEQVIKKFPFDDLPKNYDEKKDKFVDMLCILVATEIEIFLNKPPP